MTFMHVRIEMVASTQHLLHLWTVLRDLNFSDPHTPARRLINRLFETEPVVFKFCRSALYRKDPFSRGRNSCRCAARCSNSPNHRLSVDIFPFSGHSGILASDRKQNIA